MKNPMRRTIHIRAYAKINLGLFIKEKRSDGFHEIETIFLPTKLYDKITIEKSLNNITIECSDPSVPVDNTNLTYIAFQKLRERYPSKIKEGVKIYIKKNIPVGGGLGGGSSDAAAVLLGVRCLWNIGVSNRTLKMIASQVGSDVPFFIDCKPAFAKGKGEILKLFDYNLKRWILLIHPDIKISSSWAYGNFNFNLTNRIKNINLKKIIKKNIFKYGNLIFNDLEIPVFSKYSQLRKIKENLYKSGAEFALMTGSGSCLYGLFKNKSEAEKASEKFKEFGNVYLTRQLLYRKIFE